MAALVLGNVEKVLSDFRNALADPVISAFFIVFVSSSKYLCMYFCQLPSNFLGEHTLYPFIIIILR